MLEDGGVADFRGAAGCEGAEGDGGHDFCECASYFVEGGFDYIEGDAVDGVCGELLFKIKSWAVGLKGVLV